MIGVEPSPVLDSSIIVVKDPLKALKVLLQHVFKLLVAFLCLNVNLDLGPVILCLCHTRILVVLFNEALHKFDVLLAVFPCNLSLYHYAGFNILARLVLDQASQI